MNDSTLFHILSPFISFLYIIILHIFAYSIVYYRMEGFTLKAERQHLFM